VRSEQNMRPIMPVDVLIENRPCLVVGGGKIAARKAGHLLDAGARVTVVSNEVNEEVLGWALSGRLTQLNREFSKEDVRGQFLVFACTNREETNRRVVEACRRERVLCSAVDGNWVNADFLTPAILRRPEITLSISTGGQSCRRARFVKDNLGRHLHSLTMADLLVATRQGGRARAGGAAGWMKSTAELLQQIWGVHEFVIVETGESVALLAVVHPDRSVERLVAMVFNAGRPGYAPCRFARGRAAVGRTVRIAGEAGLGAAAERSAAARWSGPMIAEWVDFVLGPGAAGGAESQRRFYERLVRGFQGGNADE
jgi:siroheme synthase-like protein